MSLFSSLKTHYIGPVMAGMAINDRSFGEPSSKTLTSVMAWGAAPAISGQLFVSLMLLLAILFGVVTHGAAMHVPINSDQPTASQAVYAAPVNTADTNSAKKQTTSSVCSTRLCVATSSETATPISTEIVLSVERAVWRIFDDQVPLPSGSARLERPPRV